MCCGTVLLRGAQAGGIDGVVFSVFSSPKPGHAEATDPGLCPERNIMQLTLRGVPGEETLCRGDKHVSRRTSFDCHY